MKKTIRKPGKIDREEVKRFQSAYGIKADGKFGNQSMGQLAEITTALNRVTEANVTLRIEQNSKQSAVKVIVAIAGVATAFLAVWLLGW